MQAQRAAWRQQAPAVAPARWIFLDEFGAQTNLTRRYGRCARGQRLVEAVPAGHWQTTTVVGAIRTAGVPTAMVTDGPMTAVVFAGFVDAFLVPVLRPGDVVVMDNLSSHKGAAVAERIQAAGAEVRYLPPYSPDLNPIEKMWSKVKSSLRTAKARTTAALYEAIAQALQGVTPADCQGFFRSCGYSATPRLETL